MTRARLALAIATLGLFFAAPASAQPFFGGGGAIFDPEIDVVESGMLLDAQAVVSADRKYVTMTMRPQSTQLLAIQEFAFQTGGGRQGGVVGGGAVGQGAGFGAAQRDGAANGRAARQADGAATGSSASSRGNSVRGRPYPTPRAMANHGQTPLLERPGMHLVSRVGPAPAR